MGEGAVLRIGGAVVPCDPSGTRAIVEEWTKAFPDWRFDLLALIAEVWEVYDEAGMWRQLGVLPPDAP